MYIMRKSIKRKSTYKTNKRKRTAYRSRRKISKTKKTNYKVMSGG